MSTTISKKKWTSPELTVLVRNKPEESVLTYCKHLQTYPGTGPQNTAYGCELVTAVCVGVECNVTALS